MIGGASNPEASFPEAFFRLDGTSGTAAVDWMDEGGSAGFHGGVELDQPGAMEESSAVHLDGEGAYVDLGAEWDPYSFADRECGAESGYSVEMWVKFDAAEPDGREELFSRSEGGAGVSLYRSANGRLNFSVGPFGDVPTVSSEPVEDNEWHHVVATMAERAEPCVSISAFGFGAERELGAATVDDVAIYGEALDDAEIQSHLAVGDAPETETVLLPAIDPEAPDEDADGVPDELDNCPAVSNPDQEDSDGDGVGDACQGELDSDGDGVVDELDNCPEDVNPLQEDTDEDGVGDVCEAE